MPSKLVECEHCKGKKNCTAGGGKSCRVCLGASGHGRRGWAAVRCSYCGGRGKVLMKEEEAEEGATEQNATQEAEAAEEAGEQDEGQEAETDQGASEK